MPYSVHSNVTPEIVDGTQTIAEILFEENYPLVVVGVDGNRCIVAPLYATQEVKK